MGVEILEPGQRPVDPGGTDLQHIGIGQRVLHIEDGGHRPADIGAVLHGHGSGIRPLRHDLKGRPGPAGQMDLMTQWRWLEQQIGSGRIDAIIGPQGHYPAALDGLLMTADGEPEGGQWNFDHDNRQAWPGDPPEPPDTRPLHDHSDLWATIVASGVLTFGDPQAQACRWPTHRAEALAQLDDFIAYGLPHFGAYQDALSSQGWRLFHSLLSFALNVKMLSPREVVQAAEDAYRQGRVPLASAEGFIRQILGWREYVRGVYWAHMPSYTQANALEHGRDLPAWFWTGQTRMACMRQAVGQSLQHAYAHHIQRLMVIGNFALLAGLHPHAVHEWYLGVYIDAFEWVEAPNTLGMSQFADGGRLATKPYVSSAAYIDRMGDHCKGCAYDKKAKTGPRACPFNALYWDFFDRHDAKLRGNHRLAMVYRTWDKMAPEAQDALRAQAAHTLGRLDEL